MRRAPGSYIFKRTSKLSKTSNSGASTFSILFSLFITFRICQHFIEFYLSHRLSFRQGRGRNLTFVVEVAIFILFFVGLFVCFFFNISILRQIPIRGKYPFYSINFPLRLTNCDAVKLAILSIYCRCNAGQLKKYR